MTERFDEKCDKKPKTAEETAQRVLGLLAVIGKVQDPDQSGAWVEKHSIHQYLSPEEVAFIQNGSPSEDSLATFSWRAEAIVSLIWALGGVSEMPPFNEQFSVFENELIICAINDPVNFLANAQLRNAKEIDDMEGHLYHQHWRVRDADLVGFGDRLDPSPDDPPFDELNHGIVYERRYALSWLVGWDEDWDNVRTDT